jgi:hypothetical protein
MKFFNFFRRTRVGNMYACTAGDYVGNMFMLFEKNDKEYGFLTIPSMDNKWFPKDVFDNGLKSGIIEYVERPPKHVRDICKVQYEANR